MTVLMNLVRTLPSAKFICCCWCNPRYDCHVTYTPKCNEPAKIQANWHNNTHCLCFPWATYELRHSFDLTLLTKWPILLQNAPGNPIYTIQSVMEALSKQSNQEQTDNGVNSQEW